MSLDWEILAKAMIEAAKEIFDQRWPDIRIFVEDEIKDFARAIARIAYRYKTGKLSKENAKALARAQIKSMEIILIAVEGMGIIMVEMAVNAAVDTVKTAVNSAIGFSLL